MGAMGLILIQVDLESTKEDEGTETRTKLSVS